MTILKKKISFSLYAQYFLHNFYLAFLSSLKFIKILNFKIRYSLSYLLKNVYNLSFYQPNIQFCSIIKKKDFKTFLFNYSLKLLGFKFNNLYCSMEFFNYFLDNSLFYFYLEKILTFFFNYYYFFFFKINYEQI